jgi:vacuolar protein sorting-associated protein 13A/C
MLCLFSFFFFFPFDFFFFDPRHVQLPSLTSLSTQATTIVLDQVFVIAGPGHATADEAFDQRQLETKKRRLQVSEALKSDLEEEGKPGWFGRSSIGRLAESMVQNLTVHVNRLHVRYEDRDALTGEPFAAGVTLESLQAVAAGGDWKACVGELVEGAFRKLVSLRNLSVYWDMKCAPIVFSSAEDMAAKMAALVPVEGSEQPESHRFILPPICGSAKFTFNLNYEATLKPQVQIGFDFGEIAVAVGERQWRQLTHILDGVSSEIRGIHYRKLRPLEGVSEAPRKWWQFAIEAVLIDVRTKAECFTTKWIDAFCSDRKTYVGLWYLRLRAGKKKSGCWTAAQRQSKRDIVKRRTFEQLISFRVLAEAIYRRQRGLLKKALAETSNPFKRSKIETELMDLNICAMSSEEWSKLRETLVLADMGEDVSMSAPKSSLSPDYVRQDIGFELRGLSVRLLDETCLQTITSVTLTRVAASFRGLEDGTSQFGAWLGSLEMV